MTKKAARQSVEYTLQCGENLKAIIAEAKSRKHLTNKNIADMMGMPLATFSHRKGNPEDFRLGDIWQLFQVLEISDNQRKDIVVIGGQGERL